ncbi:MAG: hypothetical protein PWP23_2415 [Candidatus Sumerlaeota bacterium]|nr:hypothetical protein [Candidatus Sumerlaeota bacterium]
MFGMLGFALIALGGIILLGAGIWQLVEAFKDSVLWGVISLIFCGAGGVVWCLVNVKDEGWKPLVAGCGGILPLALGIVMANMELAIKLVETS